MSTASTGAPPLIASIDRGRDAVTGAFSPVPKSASTTATRPPAGGAALARAPAARSA
jgi:hypothetical protein